MWEVGRHEWEYAVSFVPLLFIGAAFLLANRQARVLPSSALRWCLLLAMLLPLSLPIAVNWYSPAWNEFLKSVPILGSSSTLLRWFSSYILVIIVLAALSLDRLAAALRWRRHGVTLSA